MEDRPLITRVVLENYKSIAFCDVRLGRLSILVGPNGAGKSNFLDALRFLSELMYSPVANVIRSFDGFSRIYYRNGTGDVKIGFRVELSVGKAKAQFSFRLGVDPRYGIVFDREKCQFDQPPEIGQMTAHYQVLNLSPTYGCSKSPCWSRLLKRCPTFVSITSIQRACGSQRRPTMPPCRASRARTFRMCSIIWTCTIGSRTSA